MTKLAAKMMVKSFLPNQLAKLVCLGCSLLLCLQLTSCVSSRSKAGGRAETEIKLPPKSSRVKPELQHNHSSYSLVDPLTAHTPNWANPDMTKQLATARIQMERGFVVDGFGPFIIVSNIDRNYLEDIKENIIRASYNAFYRDFFSEQPRYVSTIYLFKDEVDYNRYSERLFKEKPTTPYGYYRSAEQVMMINVTTGTGTLVHELTHALMDLDFPTVPTWFNEGFASLFEQSSIKEGSIKGVTNWRYAILRNAVNTNTTIKLRTLLSKTNDEFYDDPDGYNYAEARYLCYYLQEKGLLQKFYARLKQQQIVDKNGILSLEEIVQKDLDSFEKDWLEWVKTLPTANSNKVSHTIIDKDTAIEIKKGFVCALRQS